MSKAKVLQKKCIVCKTKLDSEATLCHTCSSYQKRWRNELKYWGGAAAVVMIISSLVIFLWTTIPKTFFRDEVSILAFDGNRIVLSNEGFGQVYLSSVFIESLDSSINISMLRQLGYALNVGEITRYEVKPYIEPDKTLYLTFLGDCTDEEWKNFLKRSEDRSDKCFYPVFYLKDGSTITVLKSEQEIRTFNGYGTLEFYSNRKRKFYSKNFELSGLILRNNSQECLNSL